MIIVGALAIVAIGILELANMVLLSRIPVLVLMTSAIVIFILDLAVFFGFSAAQFQDT